MCTMKYFRLHIYCLSKQKYINKMLYVYLDEILISIEI